MSVRSEPLALIDDSELAADPAAVYAAWREAGPVHRAVTPGGDPVWLITRYDDVVAGFGDPRLSLSKAHSAGGYRGFALPPALDANLLNLDPPDHTRLRRLVGREFSARRIAGLRPFVEEVADWLLDAMAEDGTADLVEAYAAPLPLIVIGRLLGVAEDDRERFRSWTMTLLAPHSRERARTAVQQIEALIRDMIASKRRHPGDDLISGLIGVRDGRDRLTEDELTSLAFLLLWAGYEVTADLIGVSAYEMTRRPELRALLASQPDEAARAVDELVRHVSPTPLAIRRFAVEPVEVGGVEIPAGDTVLLLVAAANRDPAAFEDPDGLDPERERRAAQLGFGYGIHYCLGAPLARLEAGVALTRLAARFPRMAVRPDRPPRWRASFRSRGLLSLPVVL